MQAIDVIEKKHTFRKPVKFKVKSNSIITGSNKYRPPCLNFLYAFTLNSKEQKNPLAYYKFQANCITDILMDSHPNFRRNLLAHIEEEEKSEDCKDDSLIVLAFTAFDGWFRLYDFERKEPLLCLKSDFGSFNSLVFSDDRNLVALGGQDDAITLLNLQTKSALKLEAHRSFVTSC